MYPFFSRNITLLLNIIASSVTGIGYRSSGVDLEAYRDNFILETLQITSESVEEEHSDFITDQEKEFIIALFKDNWDSLVYGKGEFSDFYVRNSILNGKKLFYPGVKNPKELTLYVHYKDKIPVGSIKFFKKSLNQGVVSFLAVDNSYRRRGYAQEILKYAQNKLKKSGSKTVELMVMANNAKAINLYKNNGFKEIGLYKSLIALEKDL